MSTVDEVMTRVTRLIDMVEVDFKALRNEVKLRLSGGAAAPTAPDPTLAAEVQRLTAAVQTLETSRGAAGAPAPAPAPESVLRAEVESLRTEIGRMGDRLYNVEMQVKGLPHG